jgi:glucose/arabinose dehydrogenase
MRHTLLLLAGSVLFVAGPLVVIACGSSSSDTPPPGATPIEDGGSSSGNPPGNPPGVPPGTPPPAAQGDPCRGGVPVPADQAYYPPGTCATVVASGLGSLRQIAFAPNGDIFGVTTGGSIKRLHDEDGDGYFQPTEIKEYANTGGNGNNCHIDVANGYLYAGTATGVKRWPWSPTATDGGAGEDVVTGQPNGGHTNHTVHVYDGYLYVHSGSAGNATRSNTTGDKSEYDDNRSMIRRFNLASFTPGTPFQWLTGEIVTQGLRNANGFTRNAQGRMYAVVNGLDEIRYQGNDVHNDNPGEQVLEIAMGKKYGYPFCFTAQRVVTGGSTVVPPGTQLVNVNLDDGTNPHDDAWCAANSDKPATFIQAHSAPLDIVFFDGADPTGNLPEKYRGGAFVALHGSWDRSPATGYKVIWIPFNADGTAPMPTSTATDTTFPYETVFGRGTSAGPEDGSWAWSDDDGYSDNPRPAGVAIGPVDGALYFTTDGKGYLYRLGIKH